MEKEDDVLVMIFVFMIIGGIIWSIYGFFSNDEEPGISYTMKEVRKCENIVSRKIDLGNSYHMRCLEVIGAFESNARDWVSGVNVR